jgi:hypothetical protein
MVVVHAMWVNVVARQFSEWCTQTIGVRWGILKFGMVQCVECNVHGISGRGTKIAHDGYWHVVQKLCAVGIGTRHKSSARKLLAR